MFGASPTSDRHPTARVDSIDESSGLRVEQIAPHAWRVSEGTDRLLPLLLGFIEQHGDRYEVMQLGDTFEWSSHHTLPAALLHMRDAASELLAQRTDGDLSWVV